MDPEKRLKNIEKHGLDFIDAYILFDNPHIVAPGKTIEGEQRWLAIGMIADLYVTAVFTPRGPVTRMISMRRARNGERKKHQEIFKS